MKKLFSIAISLSLSTIFPSCEKAGTTKIPENPETREALFKNIATNKEYMQSFIKVADSTGKNTSFTMHEMILQMHSGSEDSLCRALSQNPSFMRCMMSRMHRMGMMDQECLHKGMSMMNDSSRMRNQMMGHDHMMNMDDMMEED